MEYLLAARAASARRLARAARLFAGVVRPDAVFAEAGRAPLCLLGDVVASIHVSLFRDVWRHREQLRDLPPRFDCRGRNWPEDPGTCVIEHLRKHDVVPESGETVVETPHVSPTVVRRAGFFVVVVLGPVVWVVASRC